MKTLDEMIAELPEERQFVVRERAKHLIEHEHATRRQAEKMIRERWSIIWTKDGPKLEPYNCDQPWDCVCIKRNDIDEALFCGCSLKDAKAEIGEYWKRKGQSILDMTDVEFLHHEGYDQPLETTDDE